MAKRSKPLILVVEDDVRIQREVRNKLLSASYDVITTSDGEEGLAAAVESKPDLMLVDSGLPLLGGFGLCLLLKQGDQTCDIPVLFMTERGFHPDHTQLHRTNVVDVMPKPFSLQLVHFKVQRCLDKLLTRAVH